jgi:hypothetical protein
MEARGVKFEGMPMYILSLCVNYKSMHIGVKQ